MIDAYRFRPGSAEPHGHRTSELAAAILLREHSIINPFSEGGIRAVNGGFVCDVVNSVRENGSCSTTAVFTGAANRGAWNTMLDQVEEMVAQYHRYLNDVIRPEIESEAGLVGDILDLMAPGSGHITSETAAIVRSRDFLQTVVTSIATCINHHLGATILNPTDTGTMVLIGQAVYRERMNDIYAQIARGICQGTNVRSAEDLPDCQTENILNDQQAYQNLNEILNSDTMVPPTVGFCSHFIQNGTSSSPGGRGVRDTIRPRSVTTGCAAHAVAVIGRRRHPVTRRCQYLLRNSWGTNCGYYHSDWVNDCENGNVWVDAEDLSKNTFSVEHLNNL